MIVVMSSLEHHLAPIDLREALSFTATQVQRLCARIAQLPNLHGCVILSTCNRTEIYLCCDQPCHPGQVLCHAAGVEFSPFSAGKEIRSTLRLTSLPTSVASQGVALLRRHLGSLEGKRAMVIGNGEMGKLSARLLYEAGCRVMVTLRTYRHGETVVPSGCEAQPYDRRFELMDGVDMLISATASPHYTVTVEQLAGVNPLPRAMVDLAIPRDMAKVCENAPVPVAINQVGSLISPFFTPTAVSTFVDAKGSDVGRYARYFGEMLQRGIYLAPAQFEAMFLSDAHSAEDLSATLEAFQQSLPALSH